MLQNNLFLKKLRNLFSKRKKKSFTSPSLFTLLKHIWKNKYHRQQYISIVWLLSDGWRVWSEREEKISREFQKLPWTLFNEFFWCCLLFDCRIERRRRKKRKIWNYVLSWCSDEVLSKLKKNLIFFQPTPSKSREIRATKAHIPALELWLQEEIQNSFPHLTGTQERERELKDNKSKPDWPLFLRVTHSDIDRSRSLMACHSNRLMCNGII